MNETAFFLLCLFGMGNFLDLLLSNLALFY